MRPIPLAAGQPEDERIECQGCGQVIAQRTPGGAVVFVTTPTRVWVERDGRHGAECPQCGNWVKFRLPRAA